ncbi:MAG: HAD family phosphatase [Clostridia bacterium]|nr:HAD family phosphatase [Clostridia bacterium]
MIKNILFDMGNVLMDWDPNSYLDRENLSPEDRLTIWRGVYGSAEWQMTDRGSITLDEALERMRVRIPGRLMPVAERLTKDWPPLVKYHENMIPLVEALEKEGYGLYLLTNAGLNHHEYWPVSPFARFFGDRILLSADYKVLKPEAAFYEKALSMFGLKAEECVFIDDNARNIEGACRCGIDGIVFFDRPQLERELKLRGIRPFAD